VLLALVLALLPALPAHAATYVVSNLNDSGAGSLREAITSALASPEDDTITFSVSGTINLATTLPNLTGGGALTIDGAGQDITIRGPGAGCSTNPNCRVFTHDNTLNLINLTVTNGYVTSQGGGIYNYGGTLTMTNCTVSGNTAGNGAGGIENQGTTNIVNSTISGNSGGGIANNGESPPPTLNVTNSTISGNTTGASFGGGIMHASGVATVTHSTIVSNTYGVMNFLFFDGSLTLRNTIVAHNPSGNCAEWGMTSITDGGYNLVWGDTTCPGANADPKLHTLEDNGGPTLTHGIAEGSAAIDQIPLASCPLTTDQRGQSRVDYNNDDGEVKCDIGAFELQTGQSPPNVIILQGFAAHTVGSRGYLAVIPLVVVSAVGVVLGRRKKA